MLTCSLVAALCGALAVAAVPGKSQYYPYEAFEDHPPRDQWVARLDKPHPGSPFPGPPHGPPHGPPPPPPHDPHHGPHHPKVDDKTIFQALAEDDRFSRIYKLVNYTEEITSLLNDSSKSVTFFAPPDKALRPPKHHGGKHHKKDTEFDEVDVEAFFGGDVIDTSDELEMFAALEGFVDDQLLDDGSDEDKERRKKIIKKIITAVLAYHILPAELPAKELAKNTTFPTALKLEDGSFHSEPLRLRVEQPPRLLKPTLSLNFYAKVLYADVKTKNGFIHVVNHPLFPPPSIFTTLFAFSDVFSTLTSAIQRVNFTDAIDWHYVHSSKSLQGNPALTFFAPTNGAFRRLPKRLKFYLFSPFGERALKKILAYHIVPDFILHSNWAHNATDDFVPGRMDHDDIYAQIPNAYDVEDFDFEEEIESRDSSSADSAESYEDFMISQLQGNHAGGPIYEEYARPECDGYGFASGEYGVQERPVFKSRRSSLEIPPWLAAQRSTCGCAPRPFVNPSPPPPPPPPVNPGFVPPPPPTWSGIVPPPPPSWPGFVPPPPPPCHGPAPPAQPFMAPPLPDHGRPKHPSPFPHPKPVHSANTTLPTLLANHTLALHVAQFHSVLPHRRYTTVLFVNGQLIAARDVPARNGAVHVVKKLISPRGKHGKGGHPGHPEVFEAEEMWARANDDGEEDEDWADWEEWLPQWAAED